MITQYTCTIGPFRRGFHLITGDLLDTLGPLPEFGLLHVFIQHTSAGLMINENADPDVRHDFELYFNRIAPEHVPGMRHTLEGPDDMPAHIKHALSGTSVSIPITNFQLNLGTWQGVYLYEHRSAPHQRKIILTIHGE